MNNSPANISYTDGEMKTVVFPEVKKGDLKNIKVDGERIMQIHDLAKNVTRQNQQIRFMAIVCTILCVGMVGMSFFVTSWLLSHESAIERVLNTRDSSKEIRELTSTNRIYAKKLSDEGWLWAHGTWTNK